MLVDTEAGGSCQPSSPAALLWVPILASCWPDSERPEEGRSFSQLIPLWDAISRVAGHAADLGRSSSNADTTARAVFFGPSEDPLDVRVTDLPRAYPYGEGNRSGVCGRFKRRKKVKIPA